MVGVDVRPPPRGGSVPIGGLAGAGQQAGLARVEELYWSLCAENPQDERLWTSLFQVHERTGSTLGLDSVEPLTERVEHAAPATVNLTVARYLLASRCCGS